MCKPLEVFLLHTAKLIFNRCVHTVCYFIETVTKNKTKQLKAADVLWNAQDCGACDPGPFYTQNVTNV